MGDQRKGLWVDPDRWSIHKCDDTFPPGQSPSILARQISHWLSWDRGQRRNLVRVSSPELDEQTMDDRGSAQQHVSDAASENRPPINATTKSKQTPSTCISHNLNTLLPLIQDPLDSLFQATATHKHNLMHRLSDGMTVQDTVGVPCDGVVTKCKVMSDRRRTLSLLAQWQML